MPKQFKIKMLLAGKLITWSQSYTNHVFDTKRTNLPILQRKSRETSMEWVTSSGKKDGKEKNQIVVDGMSSTAAAAALSRVDATTSLPSSSLARRQATANGGKL